MRVLHPCTILYISNARCEIVTPASRRRRRERGNCITSTRNMLLPARAVPARPLAVVTNVASRAGCIQCWTGETSASIEIRAPAELLFPAFADIERMPQWSPMLESVALVDPEARRSEWALRIPRLLTKVVNAAGFGNLVRWEAVHEVDPPLELRWRSLSGVQNAGVATFEEGADGCTTVTLTMSYTLPDEMRGVRVVQGFVRSAFAQRFVRRTMLGTMETFKLVLEAEAAQASGGAGDAEGDLSALER